MLRELAQRGAPASLDCAPIDIMAWRLHGEVLHIGDRGEYSVENVAPSDIAVYYSFLADVQRQTKDLPDGKLER